MAEKVIKQEEENEKAKILLPIESVEQFIKILSLEEKENLKIFISNNQIFLQNDNFVIFSRLVDGDFVDYKKLIPEEKQTSIIFLKQDFINTSKIINIFTNDFNQIKVSVKKKEVVLSTKNKKGNNKIKIISTIEGNEVEMNFNYKFILDSFSAINTDSVEFIFNENKPLIIKPVGDSSFQYIIMPLSK